MQTPETSLGAGMVFKTSAGRAHTTQAPLALHNLALWGNPEVRASHTLVSGPGQGGAYNAAQPPMTTLPYSLEARTHSEQAQSLEEVLFDAGAMAKILTSRVTMYLREGWRDKLFYQLDNLLDPEEWDPDDKPLQAKSFETFLKAICDLQPATRPGLGLSYAGNLIAGWRAGDSSRVSLEFEQSGRVRLIGSRFIDGEPVSFSALTPVGTLKKTLVTLNCAEWLGCA